MSKSLSDYMGEQWGKHPVRLFRASVRLAWKLKRWSPIKRAVKHLF